MSSDRKGSEEPMAVGNVSDQAISADNAVKDKGEPSTDGDVKKKVRVDGKIKKNHKNIQMDCINLHCESGVGLTEAPVFALTYFGIRRRKNTLQQVCNACYKLAENHNVDLYTMLKNGEPLLRADFLKFKDDVVTMDYEETICDDEPLSNEITNMVEDELNDTISEVLMKCNLDFQVKESYYILNEQMVDLEAKSNELFKEFKEMDDKIAQFRNIIYDPFKAKIKSVLPKDLNEKYDRFPSIPPGNSPFVQDKPRPIPSFVMPPVEVVPSSMTDIVTLAEFSVTKKALQSGPIQRVPLVVGVPVFGCSSPYGAWYPGKIINVNMALSETPYLVKFDSESSGASRYLSAKHLAYSTPSKNGYPVASRVIAMFRNPQFPEENAYYAGIIAEPQKCLNKYRYLVFFDDSFVQYVTHENILPVCKVPTNVVDDIPVLKSRQFMTDYLNQYPERPMVRFQPGMVVRVEWNDKWWSTKVMQVDASLVKLEFEKTNRTEWIYRGSTRLKPLYDQVVKGARSFGASYLKKRNLPFVEYNMEDDGTSTPTQPPPASPRNVAKKSTNVPVERRQREKTIYPLRPGQRAEFASRGIIRRMDLSKRIKGRKYKSHLCSSACVDWTNYRQMTSRIIPPLCIPLMVGFERLLLKGKMKRTVVYETPCGRKLRDMAELRAYLRVTDCAMGYDLFDFDHWVRVTDEFHLDHSMYRTHIVDISEGVENMAVSCVNEIQEAWPQVMKYSTTRLPQKGVNLNTDVSFMVCCDCTDDCFDKEKCACWQLTVSGTQEGAEGVDAGTVGYFYRRLYEPVRTGIFECHSGCQCQKAKCVNRVVQQPLSQRLQVFRTLHKGWGIRTLNDIPVGAFICIYVGRLHTEASANEGGRVYGDEYFAELDYIEVVTQPKEGYESDVEDDDDEEVDVIHCRVKKTDNDVAETVDLGGDVNRKSERTKKPRQKTPRELLGDTQEDIYVMDAKYEGNIGRYLNHSCSPNVTVQNVFVDTHDVRFPWVAFFATTHIRAGTELTWDYNYNVGSVPGKVLYCFCGTPECRGRLL